jgi:hypothetical protein
MALDQLTDRLVALCGEDGFDYVSKEHMYTLVGYNVHGEMYHAPISNDITTYDDIQNAVSKLQPVARGYFPLKWRHFKGGNNWREQFNRMNSRVSDLCRERNLLVDPDSPAWFTEQVRVLGDFTFHIHVHVVVFFLFHLASFPTNCQESRVDC